MVDFVLVLAGKFLRANILRFRIRVHCVKICSRKSHLYLMLLSLFLVLMRDFLWLLLSNYLTYCLLRVAFLLFLIADVVIAVERLDRC